MNTNTISIISVYSDLLCEWDRGSRETSFQSWIEQNYGIRRDPPNPVPASRLSFLYEVIDPAKYTLFLLKYSKEVSLGAA